MPANEDVSPDLSFGRHSVYGIVAADPKLAASTWVLRGFDFHPVPGQPTLYALPIKSTTQRVVRPEQPSCCAKSGYRVDVGPALALTPGARAEARPRSGHLPCTRCRRRRAPPFGTIAAVDDRASDRT
ncbi:hypothetical protein KQH42_28255 [Streptomyces sp. CHA1]|uniref:hypothetical protein n=1 Tax=unclassified Streptomyces TaxID=2593676 RepID=UPI001BFCB3AE|nr:MULTISPECIES: hypothetical protein [unclassified Streptomyces]MBT3160133.1 hypothetical protein [Streptomyces sp. G11C]MCO6704315.1 hypothetical protein [Streptomyces sp. CHB9.2]MCO6710585.1 hypothetical protein [Streptomyces sp. CHA3]MCO6716385.1 hypothetical protein [Streptomyces sp. CHB19.2]MCO6722516.1 hypothetical protein [Streptomyces sp. Vc714c-19]